MPERRLAQAMDAMDLAVDQLMQLRQQNAQAGEIKAALQGVEDTSERVRDCITEADLARAWNTVASLPNQPD